MSQREKLTCRKSLFLFTLTRAMQQENTNTFWIKVWISITCCLILFLNSLYCKHIKGKYLMEKTVDESFASDGSLHSTGSTDLLFSEKTYWYFIDLEMFPTEGFGVKASQWMKLTRNSIHSLFFVLSNFYSDSQLNHNVRQQLVCSSLPVTVNFTSFVNNGRKKSWPQEKLASSNISAIRPFC